MSENFSIESKIRDWRPSRTSEDADAASNVDECGRGRPEMCIRKKIQQQHKKMKETSCKSIKKKGEI